MGGGEESLQLPFITDVAEEIKYELTIDGSPP